MIPSDMSVIYVSFYIGKKGNKNYYTVPRKIYANVVYNSQNIIEENISRLRDFDLTLSIPIGDDIQNINENCVFWINIMPNDKADNYDFKVKRLGDYTSELISVYCESIASNNNNLYYCNNGVDIYEFKIQYEKSKNKAIVRFNTYIPFNENSIIWNKKPFSVSDTTGRIVYVNKILNGNSYIIEFKEYENNG